MIWFNTIICQRSVLKNIIMILHKFRDLSLPLLYVTPEILKTANILDFPIQTAKIKTLFNNSPKIRDY